MSLKLLQASLLGQYEASLAMLKEAIERCPPAAWDEPVARWSPRRIAWHTLTCTNYYLGQDEAAFEPHALYEEGLAENRSDPPIGLTVSRTLDYVEFCFEKLRRVISDETIESLSAPTGFERGFSRLEMHIYNLRHVQHHVGQLSAHVRRHDPDLAEEAMDWIDTGAVWPPPGSKD